MTTDDPNLIPSGPNVDLSVAAIPAPELFGDNVKPARNSFGEFANLAHGMVTAMNTADLDRIGLKRGLSKGDLHGDDDRPKLHQQQSCIDYPAGYDFPDADEIIAGL